MKIPQSLKPMMWKEEEVKPSVPNNLVSLLPQEKYKESFVLAKAENPMPAPQVTSTKTDYIPNLPDLIKTINSYLATISAISDGISSDLNHLDGLSSVLSSGTSEKIETSNHLGDLNMIVHALADLEQRLQGYSLRLSNSVNPK